MKLRAGLLGLTLVLSATGWAGGQPAHTVKIQLLRSGAIVVDGKQSSLSQLRGILANAKGATVWYYREGADINPTLPQFEAFKAIADANLPVRLSRKPDFSDCVDANGESHDPCPR